MAQEQINFGRPPLGIGGDTFITGFEKCNANFTELYTSIKKTHEGVGIYRYKNLSTYYLGASNAKGAIVIHLPKSKFNSTTMMTIRLRGYVYSANHGAWSLELGGYNYTNSAWHNTSAALTGKVPFTQVQFAHASDHQVIILGTADTTWAYPSVQVEEIICSYNKADDWDSGWSITMDTSISAYTKAITHNLFGAHKAESADKLSTSRTINGVAFNGTANITIADNTKLPLTGGTLTGNLIIKDGTAEKTVQLGSSGGYFYGHSSAIGLYKDGTKFVRLDTTTGAVTNGVGTWTGDLTGNAASADRLKTSGWTAGFSSLSWIKFATVTIPQGGRTMVIRIQGGAGYNKDSPHQALEQSICIKSSNGSADANGETQHINLVMTSIDETTDIIDLAWKRLGSNKYEIYLFCEPYHSMGYVAEFSSECALTWNNTYLGVTTMPAGLVGGVTRRLVPISGNVATATRLRTARTINGVAFDGTANISLPVFTTGATGLVPARSGTTTTKFLREDGTWVVPTNTTYTAMTATEAATGTGNAIRSISASVLKGAIQTHAPDRSQMLGTTAVKAIAYNAQSISEDITIPGNVNALSAGPISIDSGKTVTVTSGATWTIV